MERYFFPEESTPDLIIQIIHHHAYLQTHVDQDANEFHMTGFKPVNSVISFFNDRKVQNTSNCFPNQNKTGDYRLWQRVRENDEIKLFGKRACFSASGKFPPLRASTFVWGPVKCSNPSVSGDELRAVLQIQHES